MIIQGVRKISPDSLICKGFLVFSVVSNRDESSSEDTVRVYTSMCTNKLSCCSISMISAISENSENFLQLRIWQCFPNTLDNVDFRRKKIQKKCQ